MPTTVSGRKVVKNKSLERNVLSGKSENRYSWCTVCKFGSARCCLVCVGQTSTTSFFEVIQVRMTGVALLFMGENLFRY